MPYDATNRQILSISEEAKDLLITKELKRLNIIYNGLTVIDNDYFKYQDLPTKYAQVYFCDYSDYAEEEYYNEYDIWNRIVYPKFPRFIYTFSTATSLLPFDHDTNKTFRIFHTLRKLETEVVINDYQTMLTFLEEKLAEIIRIQVGETERLGTTVVFPSHLYNTANVLYADKVMTDDFQAMIDFIEANLVTLQAYTDAMNYELDLHAGDDQAFYDSVWGGSVPNYFNIQDYYEPILYRIGFTAFFNQFFSVYNANGLKSNYKAGALINLQSLVSFLGFTDRTFPTYTDDEEAPQTVTVKYPKSPVVFTYSDTNSSSVSKLSSRTYNYIVYPSSFSYKEDPYPEMRSSLAAGNRLHYTPVFPNRNYLRELRYGKWRDYFLSPRITPSTLPNRSLATIPFIDFNEVIPSIGSSYIEGLPEHTESIPSKSNISNIVRYYPNGNEYIRQRSNVTEPLINSYSLYTYAILYKTYESIYVKHEYPDYPDEDGHVIRPIDMFMEHIPASAFTLLYTGYLNLRTPVYVTHVPGGISHDSNITDHTLNQMAANLRQIDAFNDYVPDFPLKSTLEEDDPLYDADDKGRLVRAITASIPEKGAPPLPLISVNEEKTPSASITYPEVVPVSGTWLSYGGRDAFTITGSATTNHQLEITSELIYTDYDRGDSDYEPDVRSLTFYHPHILEAGDNSYARLLNHIYGVRLIYKIKIERNDTHTHTYHRDSYNTYDKFGILDGTVPAADITTNNTFSGIAYHYIMVHVKRTYLDYGPSVNPFLQALNQTITHVHHVEAAEVDYSRIYLEAEDPLYNYSTGGAMPYDDATVITKLLDGEDVQADLHSVEVFKNVLKWFETVINPQYFLIDEYLNEAEELIPAKITFAAPIHTGPSWSESDPATNEASKAAWIAGNYDGFQTGQFTIFTTGAWPTYVQQYTTAPFQTPLQWYPEWNGGGEGPYNTYTWYDGIFSNLTIITTPLNYLT